MKSMIVRLLSISVLFTSSLNAGPVFSMFPSPDPGIVTVKVLGELRKLNLHSSNQKTLASFTMQWSAQGSWAEPLLGDHSIDNETQGYEIKPKVPEEGATPQGPYGRLIDVTKRGNRLLLHCLIKTARGSETITFDDRVLMAHLSKQYPTAEQNVVATITIHAGYKKLLPPEDH